MPLPTADYERLASFRHALRGYLHFSEEEAAHFGLSSQQYQALLAVRATGHGGRMTINDLSQQLLIKHNSAVGLVDRLAEENLLRRHALADDRRKVGLYLTTKGKSVLAKLAGVHRTELRRLAPVMSRVLKDLGR